MGAAGLLVAVGLALAAGPVAAQSGKPPASGKKLYRWVDDKGVVHYGDSVPPQYANQDRDVLNRQGTTVGKQEGTLTASEAKAKADAERAAREAVQRQQRDRMLQQSYGSVEEIELLRDRRVDMVDAQIKVQQQSLNNLRTKQAQLQQQVDRARGLGKEPPDHIRDDLSRSSADLRTAEKNLVAKQAERDRLKAQFEADIARFKELKRGGRTATAAATP